MKDGCKCNRSAKTLNQLFYEKLCAFTIDEKYIEPIKDEFLKCFNESVKEGTTTLTILKARKTETDKKLEALEERFAIGEINSELYQKFVSKYNGYRGKLELQELMFPNGIFYNREKNEYRTTEPNPVMFTIAEISRSFEGKNKGDNGFFQLLSPSVPHTIPNLNELLADTRDMARIWDLYGHLVKDRPQGL